MRKLSTGLGPLLLSLLAAGSLAGCNCGGRVWNRMPPTARVSTTLLDFGPVRVGQTGEAVVRLTNTGQDPLEVSGILMEQELPVFFKAASDARVEGGETFDIAVRFEPAAARQYQGRLVIESDASNAPVIEVQLLGEGVTEGSVDGGGADGGGVDAGQADAGAPDAGPPDASVPDAGSADACTPLCQGVACGAADGCGGSCRPGYGCTQADAGACTGPLPASVTCTLPINGDRRAVPAIGDDGTVYVNGHRSGAVVRPSLLAIRGCAQQWEFVPPDPDLSSCNAPVIRPDGNILFPCFAGLSNVSAVTFVLRPDGTTQATLTHAAGLAPTHLALGTNGTLYMGHRRINGSFYAYSGTGSPKWVSATGGSEFRLASAIDGLGRVHAGTWHYPGQPPNPPFAGVYSLVDNVSSAGLAWVFRPPEDIGPYGVNAVMLNSAPAIGASGTVYAGVVGQLNGNLGTSLYALDPATGGELWHHTVPSNPMATNAHLAIGPDGAIYMVSSDFNAMVLTAVTSTGQPKWPAPAVLSDVCFGCETGPAIGANGVLYLGAKDCAYGLDTATGARAWALPIAGAAGVPAIATDGTVYFVTDTMLYGVATNAAGLARSSWPRALHDRKNTANVATALP